MEALEAILTRRSVRKFKSDKKISNEIIDKLLTAGMSAPSAHNQQPWHFIVVQERANLDKIAEVHPYAKMCLEAPLAIIGCVDLNLTKSPLFWVQDLAAATENILVAGRALGLGSVWVGVYPAEERSKNIQQLFSLPSNIIPFNVMVLGYTDVIQEADQRYRKDRVHYEKW